MKRYAIVNKSTLVSNDQCEKIAQAIQIQMAVHVAPAWDRLPPEVKFYTDEKLVPLTPDPSDTRKVAIVDTDDVPDALGWHTEGKDGAVYAHVSVKPVLDNGGGVLDGGTAGVSLASVVGHECGETEVDEDVNDYVDGPQIEQGSCYAKEIGDPVESNMYPVTLVDGTVVYVNAFVTPDWFNPTPPVGAVFTYPPGIVDKPFTLAPGGYCVCRFAPGSEAQVFGEVMPPAWKMKMKAKNSHSRHNRRHHKA